MSAKAPSCSKKLQSSTTCKGFSGGTSRKEPTCQCRRHQRLRFNPWVRKIPWRRAWQPTPVFLPEESHGQRSLVGYSPWGRKESDTSEHLSTQKYVIKFQGEEAKIALVLLKIYLKLQYFFQNLRLLTYLPVFLNLCHFPFYFYSFHFIFLHSLFLLFFNLLL